MFETDDSQVRLAGAVERRSPRILRHVALKVAESDGGPELDATTAVINRQGALMLCARAFAPGTRLKVTHVQRQLSARFRVAWYGGQAGGLHKVGIELLGEELDFWGDAYDPDADAEPD